MGWLNIFGTEKVVSKGMDMIDDAFYTDQEEAEDAKGKREWKLKLLQAYQPFKTAQRLLALLYSIPYVSIVVYATIMNDMVLMERVNEALGMQCLAIVSFYFMGGVGEGMINASLNKNKK